jgi:hypothetical protein
MTGGDELDDGFDWKELSFGGNSLEGLLGLVEGRLRAGASEETAYDQLVQDGIPPDLAARLLVEALRRKRNESPSGPTLVSGPYDVGGVFDSLAEWDAKRREGRHKRRERREQSARLASAEPDPTFAQAGIPTFAQLQAERVKHRDWRRYIPAFVLLLALLPFLLFATLCLLSSFWRK